MKSKVRLLMIIAVTLVAAFAVLSVAADGPDPSAADTVANEMVGAPVEAPLVGSEPSGTILYDNGPLVNCPGCGVGGADESVLQNTSLGMSVFGFGHQVSAGNRIADDFTVPAGDGWDVLGFRFYAYQSFAGTTSTITAVNYRIWDGEPGNGGTVIYGDNVTNQMVLTDWTNIYRVTETTSGGNTDRAIMWDEVNIGLGGGVLHLDPGTYWVDWQTDGSAASGPWAPPVTINGQCVTGNALQSLTDNGVTWAPVVDTGSGCAQDFPFLVFGEDAGNPDPTLRGYLVKSDDAGVAPTCWYFAADRWFNGHNGIGRYMVKELTPTYAKFSARVGGPGGWEFRGITRPDTGVALRGTDNDGNRWVGHEDPTCVP